MSCGYYFILRMKIFFIIKVRTIFLTVNNFISIKINLAKVPSFIHFRLIFESDLKSKIIRSYNAFLANSPQIFSPTTGITDTFHDCLKYCIIGEAIFEIGYLSGPIEFTKQKGNREASIAFSTPPLQPYDRRRFRCFISFPSACLPMKFHGDRNQI